VVLANRRRGEHLRMTSSALTPLIGLVLIVWICSRQLRWRPADPARMWKLPLVLGVLGVILLARQAGTIRLVDVVILVISGVLALISGSAMGRIARFRPVLADPRLVESRAGWLGVAIWAGLVAVRVALDVAGHRLGSDLALSTGSLLLMVALNRAASAAVVSARLPRAAAATAGR
jgi:hypothetical protein